MAKKIKIKINGEDYINNDSEVIEIPPAIFTKETKENTEHLVINNGELDVPLSEAGVLELAKEVRRLKLKLRKVIDFDLDVIDKIKIKACELEFNTKNANQEVIDILHWVLDLMDSER